MVLPEVLTLVLGPSFLIFSWLFHSLSFNHHHSGLLSPILATWHMSFSRQKYQSRFPFQTTGIVWPRIKAASLMSPTLAGGFLATLPCETLYINRNIQAVGNVENQVQTSLLKFGRKCLQHSNKTSRIVMNIRQYDLKLKGIIQRSATYWHKLSFIDSYSFICLSGNTVSQKVRWETSAIFYSYFSSLPFLHNIQYASVICVFM